MSTRNSKRKRVPSRGPLTARRRVKTAKRIEATTPGDRYLVGCHPDLAASLPGLRELSAPRLAKLYRDALELTPMTVTVGSVVVPLEDAAHKNAQFRLTFGKPTPKNVCRLLADVFRRHPEMLGRDISAALPADVWESILGQEAATALPAAQVSRRWRAITAERTEQIASLRRAREMATLLFAVLVCAVDGPYRQIALDLAAATDGETETASLAGYSGDSPSAVVWKWTRTSEAGSHVRDIESAGEAIDWLAAWIQYHPDAQIGLRYTDLRDEIAKSLKKCLRGLGPSRAAALLGVEREGFPEVVSSVVGRHEAVLASPTGWLSATERYEKETEAGTEGEGEW